MLKHAVSAPGASAAHDYLRQDKSKEKRFAFDQAFGPDADTKTLFTATAEPLIKSAPWWHHIMVKYGETWTGDSIVVTSSNSLSIYTCNIM